MRLLSCVTAWPPRRRWLALAALGAAGAIAAQAQTAGSPAMPAPAPAPEPAITAPVSDAKLRQFMTAVTNVQEVQEQFVIRAQMLHLQMQQQLVHGVEDTGMSVDEYELLHERVQRDPYLAQRIENLQMQ